MPKFRLPRRQINGPAAMPTTHTEAVLWIGTRLSDSYSCLMLQRADLHSSTPPGRWQHLTPRTAALAGTTVHQVIAHAETAALVPAADLTPEQVAARWTRFHGDGTVALYAGGGWLSVTRNGAPQPSVRVSAARAVLAAQDGHEVWPPRPGKQARMANLAQALSTAGYRALGAATGRVDGRR